MPISLPSATVKLVGGVQRGRTAEGFLAPFTQTVSPPLIKKWAADESM